MSIQNELISLLSDKITQELRRGVAVVKDVANNKIIIDESCFELSDVTADSIRYNLVLQNDIRQFYQITDRLHVTIYLRCGSAGPDSVGVETVAFSRMPDIWEQSTDIDLLLFKRSVAMIAKRETEAVAADVEPRLQNMRDNLDVSQIKNELTSHANKYYESRVKAEIESRVSSLTKDDLFKLYTQHVNEGFMRKVYNEVSESADEYASMTERQFVEKEFKEEMAVRFSMSKLISALKDYSDEFTPNVIKDVTTTEIMKSVQSSNSVKLQTVRDDDLKILFVERAMILLEEAEKEQQKQLVREAVSLEELANTPEIALYLNSLFKGIIYHDFFFTKLGRAKHFTLDIYYHQHDNNIILDDPQEIANAVTAMTTHLEAYAEYDIDRLGEYLTGNDTMLQVSLRLSVRKRNERTDMEQRLKSLFRQDPTLHYLQMTAKDELRPDDPADKPITFDYDYLTLR